MKVFSSPSAKTTRPTSIATVFPRLQRPGSVRRPRGKSERANEIGSRSVGQDPELHRLSRFQNSPRGLGDGAIAAEREDERSPSIGFLAGDAHRMARVLGEAALERAEMGTERDRGLGPVPRRVSSTRGRIDDHQRHRRRVCNRCGRGHELDSNPNGR